MSSRYIQKFPSPPYFDEIIHDFTKEILRNQPEDIIEFAALYFKCLQEGIVCDYQRKGSNIPCDFKNIVPKLPESKIQKQKNYDLANHNKAVENSENNRDNLGAKINLNTRKTEESEKTEKTEKKELKVDTKTEVRKDTSEVKNEIVEGKEKTVEIKNNVEIKKDPEVKTKEEKKESSSNLIKIGNNFIGDIWQKKSFEFQNEIDNEKNLRDEMNNIKQINSKRDRNEYNEKLEIKLLEILKPLIGTATEQRLDTEENKYIYYSENENNSYFPKGIPMKHAEDYFSFNEKINGLKDNFNDSENMPIEYSPKKFYGHIDNVTNTDSQSYIGHFIAIYEDQKGRVIQFNVKYHSTEDGKDVNDEISFNEIKI